MLVTFLFLHIESGKYRVSIKCFGSSRFVVQKELFGQTHVLPTSTSLVLAQCSHTPVVVFICVAVLCPHCSMMCCRPCIMVRGVCCLFCKTKK